jgi:hypothetical protein
MPTALSSVLGQFNLGEATLGGVVLPHGVAVPYYLTGLEPAYWPVRVAPTASTGVINVVGAYPARSTAVPVSPGEVDFISNPADSYASQNSSGYGRGFLPPVPKEPSDADWKLWSEIPQARALRDTVGTVLHDAVRVRSAFSTVPNAGMSGLGAVSTQSPRAEACGLSVLDWQSSNRRQFFTRGVVLTPYPADGDVPVVTMTVPANYVHVLLAYYTVYGGTGFVQGSGDIIWRLRTGNQWAKGMGSMPFALGGLANPFTIEQYIVVRGGQTITMYVNVPNLSGNVQSGSAYVLCGLQGWSYAVTARPSWLAESRRGHVQ